jgi:hypothetical protein
MVHRPLRKHPELEKFQRILSIVDDLVRLSGFTQVKMAGVQVVRFPIDNNASRSSDTEKDFIHICVGMGRRDLTRQKARLRKLGHRGNLPVLEQDSLFDVGIVRNGLLGEVVQLPMLHVE